MTLATRILVLKAATATLLIGFGAIMALSALPPFATIVHWFLALARLDFAGSQISEPAGLLVAGIGGGLCAGFGVCLWQVIDRVHARDPELGRSIILPAIVVWFVLDSTGSILAGAWFNAILNLGILGIFLVALLGPVPADRPAS